jgi:Xaa-Pro aminopeptidase
MASLAGGATAMEEDALRTDRIRQGLRSAGIDAVMGQLAPNVLMLSGYSPVLGQSFALFPVRGEPCLIVPDSEYALALEGWCADVRTFPSSPLDPTTNLWDLAAPAISVAMAERGLTDATIGYEVEDTSVPASYPQVSFPTCCTIDRLRQLAPCATFTSVSAELGVLRSYVTPREARHLAAASDLAGWALRAARDQVKVAGREATIAAAAESIVQDRGRSTGVRRVSAFAHILTGARSAQAYQSPALTNERRLQNGDPVLVQVEVCADGYWASVARTFFAGDPGAEGRRLYEACCEASRRSRQAIRDGVAASVVDAAARDYLAKDGFTASLRDGLGHGVGFEPLSRRQPPRFYPGSTDTIQTDMAFVLHPGLYVRGWGGVRIGDVIVARAQGCDVLTNLPTDLAWAMVPQRARL